MAKFYILDHIFGDDLFYYFLNHKNLLRICGIKQILKIFLRLSLHDNRFILHKEDHPIAICYKYFWRAIVLFDSPGYFLDKSSSWFKVKNR